MNLEEFKKKYGSETAVLMIDHLLYLVTLSPYAQRQYDELRQDLKQLFK